MNKILNISKPEKLPQNLTENVKNTYKHIKQSQIKIRKLMGLKFKTKYD